MGRRMTQPPISWLMGLTLQRPSLISLAAGFTDSRTLPVESARELFNQLLADDPAARAAVRAAAGRAGGHLASPWHFKRKTAPIGMSPIK